MSCKIFMDRGPHLSGAAVQGRLECVFHKSEKIRGIKLRVFGDERTEWIGSEQHYDEVTKRYETISFPLTGDNNLIDFELMLFGGVGETHLGPGTFNYPFTFQLPPNLPSSFMNNHGYIRYGVKAVVDIPWAMDYEDKMYFEVASPIDLNTFPMECFQPVSRSDSKTVCCWCCAQGEISLDININKTAFVPGENVKLFMTLTNMSNSNVDEVSAKFMQYVKSKVEHPHYEHKEDQYEFGFKTWSGVGAHGENQYDMEILIPPQAPFPNLNRSSLFEISYDVEICANIDGCHSNMDLSFSIEIGHIQHQSQLGSNPLPPVEGIAPVYPPTTSGYPYPISQPTAPLVNTGGPNAGTPYPQPSQMPQPSGPPYPAGSNTGVVLPPDYQSVYPTGRPESSSSTKMKAAESHNHGDEAPSAPPTTDDLPPSYEDASKFEKK